METRKKQKMCILQKDKQKLMYRINVVLKNIKKAKFKQNLKTKCIDPEKEKCLFMNIIKKLTMRSHRMTSKRK